MLAPEENESLPEGQLVRAPMVGTFYAAASPGAAVATVPAISLRTPTPLMTVALIRVKAVAPSSWSRHFRSSHRSCDGSCASRVSQ